MIWIALSLGFLGSLHCIGMCGPLSIMACTDSKGASIKRTLSYNFGRISTYAFLGLICGVIGTLLFISHWQKAIAISIGTIMVLSFFLQYNIDHLLQKSAAIRKLHQVVQKRISNSYQSNSVFAPFTIGMLNGLLPCGLVYLAIAGSLACTNWLDGALFMIAFGLGTVPAMAGLVGGYSFLPTRKKIIFRKILPFVTLVFGLFLMYRAAAVEMPLELNFWEAMKNPTMCH